MRSHINIQNKKASFDYFFLKEYISGIQLFGSEVKAIRENKVALVESFCYFKDNELFIKCMNISVLKNSFQHEPLRERKLLLNRKELDKLQRDLDDGMTIVVKRLFTNEKNLIKAEIALAKGKKNYDKRASQKEKDMERELKRDY